MKVQELMTKDVKTCSRGNNLAEAAELMWDGDCGALPVVDDAGKVVGIVSDRDICFAVATKGRLASEILVGEVASGRPLYTCAPGDDVRDALSTMQWHQVRRIPVVNDEGKIAGILSLSDIILAAEIEAHGQTQGVSDGDALATMKAICEQRRAAPNAAAASSGGAATP
jgi:CBS domain-containing protein